MSAYVVNKEHISAMIRQGLQDQLRHHSPLRWFYKGEWQSLTRETVHQVGQMLLDENVKSVMTRYEDDDITNLPGRTNAEWLIPFHANTGDVKTPTPVEALKLIGCYEYQSCEHDGWASSEAFAFCGALRQSMIYALPGYDDAPWEWVA